MNDFLPNEQERQEAEQEGRRRQEEHALQLERSIAELDAGIVVPVPRVPPSLEQIVEACADQPEGPRGQLGFMAPIPELAEEDFASQ